MILSQGVPAYALLTIRPSNKVYQKRTIELLNLHDTTALDPEKPIAHGLRNLIMGARKGLQCAPQNYYGESSIAPALTGDSLADLNFKLGTVYKPDAPGEFRLTPE